MRIRRQAFSCVSVSFDVVGNGLPTVTFPDSEKGSHRSRLHRVQDSTPPQRRYSGVRSTRTSLALHFLQTS